MSIVFYNIHYTIELKKIKLSPRLCFENEECFNDNLATFYKNKKQHLVNYATGKQRLDEYAAARSMHDKIENMKKLSS